MEKKDLKDGEVGYTRRRRKKKRKEFRPFTISMEVADYEAFLDYLDKYDIESGSALIRDLLREKGILPQKES